MNMPEESCAASAAPGQHRLPRWRAIAGALLLAATGAAGTAAAKQPEDWPRRVGADGPECRQALQLARTAFRSTDEYLVSPLRIPEGFPSQLALWTDGLDLSGGDALLHDEAVFQKVAPLPGESRGLYWQKEALDGRRLAVFERPMGWRGDSYSLYALPEAVTAEQFRAARTDEHSTPHFPSVIGGTWRAPQLLRGSANRLWVLHQGELYGVLSAWTVFTAGPGGVGPKQACTIHFRPQVKDVWTLLPREVRTLAGLLEKSLGSGENEGTLRPTARISAGMRNVWANVLLRPWATIKPYNTSAEVDAGLQEWAKRGPSYRAFHARLMRQKPLAERALAAHYRSRFGLSAQAAREQAAFSTDLAFRSGFVFSTSWQDRQSPERADRPNPWQ